MNLEELQIKVSIELKDLEKQLKNLTKSIDKSIGPKATEKLMRENHKIIQRESLAINKTLNKAFDVDYKSFNNNLNAAMNQAKLTVRSACNDIRRELNNALNVKANIRVSASASVSNQGGSSRNNNAAAITASSQYTGAMITKAVNEMIKVNNANTKRLEGTIDKSAKEIVSAIKTASKDSIAAQNTQNTKKTKDTKDNTKSSHEAYIKTEIETALKVATDGLQDKVNHAIKNIKVDNLVTSIEVDNKNEKVTVDAEFNIDSDDLQNKVNKAIREIDTPNLTTNIEVNDKNAKQEAKRVIDSIDVPGMKVDLKLNDNNTQNEVNKVVREVVVPELKAELSLRESLQNEINNAMQGIEVPNLNTKLNVNSENLQSEIDKKINGVDVPELISDVKIRYSELQNEINKIIRETNVPNLITEVKIEEDLQNTVNNAVQNVQPQVIPVSIEIDEENLKSRIKNAFEIVNVGEIIDSQIAKSTVNFKRIGELKDGLVDVVKLMKQIHSLRKGLLADTTSFKMGDITSEYHTGKVVNQKKSGSTKALETEEPLKVSFKVIDDELEAQINEAVSKIKQISLPKDVFNFETDEIIAKVRETNEHIKKAFKDAQNLRKQANMPLLEAPIEEAKVDMELFKEIVGQAIAIIMDLKALEDYFNSDSMDIEKAAKDALKLGEALIDIEEAAKKLDGYDLSGLGISDGVTDELKPFVDTLERAWILIGKISRYNPKPIAPAGIPMDLEEHDVDDLLNPPRPRKPESLNNLPITNEQDVNDLLFPSEIDIPVSIDVSEAKERIDKITKQIKEDMADLVNVGSDLNKPGSYVTNKGNKLIGKTGTLKSNPNMMPPIEVPDEKVEITVDTDEAQKQLASVNEKLEEVSINIEEVMEAMRLVKFPEFKIAYGSIDNLIKSVVESIKTLTSELEKLKEIKLTIDTSDTEKRLKNLLDISKTVRESLEKGDYIPEVPPKPDKKPQYPPKAPGQNKSKDTKDPKGKPPKPTIMGFGFGAYKNEIDMLAEYAKKAGEKIKKAASKIKKDSGGPDELAMTIDDSFNDEIVDAISEVVTVLKSIESIVKNIFGKSRTRVNDDKAIIDAKLEPFMLDSKEQNLAKRRVKQMRDNPDSSLHNAGLKEVEQELYALETFIGMKLKEGLKEDDIFKKFERQDKAFSMYRDFRTKGLLEKDTNAGDFMSLAELDEEATKVKSSLNKIIQAFEEGKLDVREALSDLKTDFFYNKNLKDKYSEMSTNGSLGKDSLIKDLAASEVNNLSAIVNNLTKALKEFELDDDVDKIKKAFETSKQMLDEPRKQIENKYSGRKGHSLDGTESSTVLVNKLREQEKYLKGTHRVEGFGQAYAETNNFERIINAINEVVTNLKSIESAIKSSKNDPDDYLAISSDDDDGSPFVDPKILQKLEETFNRLKQRAAELKVDIRDIFKPLEEEFDGVSNLPMLRSDALNEQFEAIKASIKEAHKAYSDFMEYVMWASNYNIFQALGKPGAFTSKAFKEVTMLYKAIQSKLGDGQQIGIELMNQKETEEEVQDIIDFFEKIKHLSSDDFKLNFDVEGAKQALLNFKKELIKTKEDFNSSSEDIEIADKILPHVNDVLKRIKQIEDEDAEINLKLQTEQTEKAKDLFYLLQSKSDVLKQAVEDLFDSAKTYAEIPLDTKFDKAQEEADALREHIRRIIEEYERLNAQDLTQEIEGSTSKLFQALKDQIAFMPKAFKEVAALYKAIESMTGMEPGLELREIQEQIDSLHDLNAFIEELKQYDDAEFEFVLVYDEESAKKNIADLKELKEGVQELKDSDIEIDVEIADKVMKDIDDIIAKINEIRNRDVFDGVFAIGEEIEFPEFKMPETLEAIMQLKKMLDENPEIKLAIEESNAEKAKQAMEELYELFKNLSGNPFELDMKKAILDTEKLKHLLDAIKNRTKVDFKVKSGDFSTKPLGVGSGKFTTKPVYTVPGAIKLDNALTKLESKVASVFAKINARTKNSSSTISSSLKKAFSGIGSKVMSKLPESVRSSMGKAAKAVREYSSVIKRHFNKAFGGIDTSKLFSKVKSGIEKGLNGAKKALSKFANGIGKGLNGAKKVLGGFANASKSLWGKIKSIFSKGASDAAKATGKLKTGLGNLLKQALGFFSLYGLINLGKEAIQQSTQLAQSEVKLASLMKQRMGATNETIAVIRQLAEEQAKAGVVSETAMKNGAQQLARYVHSAKALKELMPAIANLTAARGGVFATPEDAEEIATQLGEAIREGTTTPLEQSGIYLSEAEIQKFAALRTEEERAAYLADVIAKNVGNINEALANTPHGAIAQLKNNFQSLLGTLGIFLANVIKPIVQWLNVIVVACNNALKALGKLLGFDMTGGAESVPDIGTGGGGGGSTPVDTTTPEIDTGGIDDAKDAYNDAKDAADEATEANEKFKGSLMGFDEINILSDNTQKSYESDSDSDPSDEYDPTDITPGTGGQLIPEVGELTEADSVFDKFSDKMKAFLDEVIEPFKNAWALLGDRWKAEWADLIESFKHFCDSLGKFLVSVWEHGGKEFVQHMAEIALAVGIAAMEIGGEILDSLARLWDHLAPAKNMNTQGFLDALNEVSVKLRDFILGLGDHFESLMANGGQDVLNAMGDCFMNLGEAAVRGLGVAIDALDGLIDHLDPANNEITRNMLKSWEDAFHAIGNCALELANLLESVLANGGQEVINALGDAFVSFAGLVGDIVKEVSDAFAGLFKHLDPATNEFTKDFLKAWENAFKEISTMFGKMGDFLGSVMDNGGQELLNSIGDLGMKIGEAVGVVVEEFAKAFGELLDHLDPSKNSRTKNMLKSLDGLVDSITKFVDSCIKAFKKFMDSGGREFINNLGDILAVVVDLAATLAGGIIDLLTAFMDSFAGQALIEGVAKALEWVSEKILALEDVVNRIKDIFQDVIDIIVGILEGDGEKVGRAFANLIKNAFFLTQDIMDWLIDIGIDLIEGLIEGLKKTPEIIWNTIVFVFDTIVGFFKELFGIHSPSTVFAELGVNLIEGLVEGIGSMVSAVWDAITLLADSILEAFQGIVDKLSEIWENIKESVSEAWNTIKDTVVEKCEEVYNNTSEKWEQIKETVSDKCKEMNEGIKEKYTEIKDIVSDKIKETYDKSKEKWENIKKNTAEITATIKKEAEDKYNKLKEALTNTMDKWRQSSEEKWSKIKEKTSDLVSKIKSETEDKYNKFKETLTTTMENWRKNSEEKWTKIKDRTTTLAENLKSTVEDKYNKFKNNLTTTLENLRSTSEDKWNKVKEKTGALIEDLRSNAEKTYSTLKTNLGNKINEIKSDAQTKWNEVKEKTVGKVSEVVNDVTTKYGEIKGNLTGKMDEVKNALGPKWEELKTNVKTGAEGMVKKAGEGLSGLSKTMTDAIDKAKTAASNAWDKLKDVFSGGSFNMPKLPKLEITWETIPESNWFPEMKIPKLSWNARGGIIDGITPLGFANGALQMGGEAGSELVMPLENTSFTSKIAMALGQAVDNALAKQSNPYNNNNNTMNDNRDIVLKVNERELARASINSINKLQRESGRTLLDI